MSENTENIQNPKMDSEISDIDCKGEEVENVSENSHNDTESDDNDEFQPNEENQPVKKEPPNYGSFTKFTIDHILNSEDPCKNQRNDLNHRLAVPTNESTGNKLISSWITNSFARLSKTTGQQDYGVETFQFPGFPQEQSSESPVSSDSDETALEPHSDRTGERTDDSSSSPTSDQHSEYSWLHCTRYKPPKLPSEFLYCVLRILLLYLNTRRVCLHNSSCLIFVYVWYKFNLI